MKIARWNRHLPLRAFYPRTGRASSLETRTRTVSEEFHFSAFEWRSGAIPSQQHMHAIESVMARLFPRLENSMISPRTIVLQACAEDGPRSNDDAADYSMVLYYSVAIESEEKDRNRGMIGVGPRLNTIGWTQPARSLPCWNVADDARMLRQPNRSRHHGGLTTLRSCGCEPRAAVAHGPIRL